MQLRPTPNNDPRNVVLREPNVAEVSSPPASNNGRLHADDGVDGPIHFASKAVRRVWGGRALETVLGHCLPTDQPYGEIWDISDLPEHSSIVSDGPHRGRSLSELWQSHCHGLCSRQTSAEGGFPLLIKWLDCFDWLSVQVHPDDSMARAVLGQPRGKSEVWIVLHAESTARIYAGLRTGVTRRDFLRHLNSNSIDECLHSFTPQAGDCVVLPAGTIHAAGGGLLIAEIQQSSDATFRIFDWNRLGLDGKPRDLQIELGLEAIDWTQKQLDPIIPRPILQRHGVCGELLAQVPEFRLERYTLSQLELSQPWIAPHAGEMTIWMVLDNELRLTHSRTGEQRQMRRGQSVLVPASAGEVAWQPAHLDFEATLLSVCLPLPEEFTHELGEFG